MFSAFSKALSQSFDPAFRGVFLRSFGITFVVFIAISLITWLGIGLFSGWFQTWLTEADIWVWLREPLLWVANAGLVASVVLGSFFLFPSVMLVAMSFFLEDIANAVEGKHYPGQGPANEMSLQATIWEALKLLMATLLLNLLALPFYLILVFVPPLNLLLFYLLNGYLYGREYFELVAQRRLEPDDATKLRRQHRLRVLSSGALIAFLLTIPVVNLITPIVATAFLLHTFEELKRR